MVLWPACLDMGSMPLSDALWIHCFRDAGSIRHNTGSDTTREVLVCTSQDGFLDMRVDIPTLTLGFESCIGPQFDTKFIFHFLTKTGLQDFR